jgi:phosphoadenosine phosphosulfate reductase
LEFPETVENVKKTADKHNLELLIEDAGDAFWKAEEHFGPPAKDFRWCCKTCKLGPTASMIRKHFPDGVLSFIGQRQYESQQRREKGNIWRNPWVPGQVGASPIQHWPSMLVWLYIFREKAEYNPLYEKGMERIGCWLCPAADMAEFNVMEHKSDWEDRLGTYAKEHGLPDEWVTYGLWRWKELPKGVKDYLELNDKGDLVDRCSLESGSNEAGHDVDLATLTPNERERVETFSCISDDIQPVIQKALYCVGCGICLSNCDNGALGMVDGKVDVDPEKCVGCGECMHPCTVVDFLPRY